MVTHSNQAHLFEVLFKSMNAANSSCSFKKQDLTSKKVKFLQLIFVFIDFYRLYLERTLFCTKPILSSFTWRTSKCYDFWFTASGHYRSSIFRLIGSARKVIGKMTQTALSLQNSSMPFDENTKSLAVVFNFHPQKCF